MPTPEPGPVHLPMGASAGLCAWSWSTPARDRVQFVSVHGLGDHGRALPSARLARRLAARGHGVWTFDLRGHGDVAASERGLAAWPELHSDLRAVVDAARAAHSQPIVVCGISLGALLSFELAVDPPPGVAGVALAAAPFGPVRTSRLAQVAARGLGRWLPRLPLSTGIDLDAVADDPAAVRVWRSDARVHTRIGAGLAAAALAAPGRLRALAPRLRLPLLLQHGLDDRLAPWDPAFAAALPAQRCIVRTYPGARHNLYLDSSSATVIDDLAGWAEHVVGQGAQPAAARPR